MFETKRSNAVIHTVEGFQKVRDKYPFKIFLRSELPNLNSKLKRVLNSISISWKYWTSYTSCQRFFIYNKKMKSYATIWKEYYHYHRDVYLEMLKFLCIMRISRQSEGKENIKNWN